jgi:Zn-dependent alcohol dehydrogenase
VSGRRGPDKFAPHMLGHEDVSIIKAVGDSVTKVCGRKVDYRMGSCRGHVRF